MINPMKERIKLNAKQLRTPAFVNYENVIRQLSPSDSYEQFLCQLMELEINQRQETSQRRKIKKASFPVMKSLDEFDYTRLEHVSESFIKELATGDYIKKRQNIVMIGNPGSGNYRKYLVMERNERISHNIKDCMLISFDNTSE